MTDARSIPAAVQWHEGMLLSPQHFQQADLRSQLLQTYTTLAATPYGWGVRRLRIDEAALVAGAFVVTELEAVMPDGLLVTHEGETDPPAPALTLDLMPLLGDAATRRVAVHVTVAAHSTLALRTGQQQRFRQVAGADVVDENTGDNAIPIPRLIPMLALHATDGPLRPPPPRLTSLPIAVLEATGQRFSRVDYEPPRLRVDHGTLLARLANRLAADLRSKATEWGVRLSGALSEGQATIVGDTIATLRMIIGGLPRLEALLKTELAHPFDVYLALCDVAGHLAVVGGQVTLPVLGAYAHADPLAAFKLVATFVDNALREMRTPYASVVFERVRPGWFEVVPQPGYISDDSLVVGARVAPGQEPHAVRAWVEAAVIGAVSRIETMLNNAVIGARREAIGRAPELDLVPPPNMLLFRIAADRAFVTIGEVLRISHLPLQDQAEPAELRLFIPSVSQAGS